MTAPLSGSMTPSPSTRPAEPAAAEASRRLGWASTAFKFAFAALVLTGAVLLLRHELRTTTIDEIVQAFRRTPFVDVLGAIVCTALSYGCLAASEWWALATVGLRLDRRRILLVSFVAYALSNGLGFSLATGGAARVRLYRVWGVGAAEIAAVTILAGVAVTLSGLVAAGMAVMLIPHIPVGLGIAAVALLTPAWLWLGRLPRQVRFLPGVRLVSPPLKQRAWALLGGILDWVFSGLALLLLMPGLEPQVIAPFLATFVLGSVVSAASGVPGGIGVFEAVVLGLSSEFAVPHETAAALLLYRLIYAIGPLTVALGYLGARPLLERHRS